LGLDHVMDSRGSIKLVEVNVYPALGWGSMKHVNYDVVYRKLVEDVLSIIVLGHDIVSTDFDDVFLKE